MSTNSATINSFFYRADIDGLRALAILAVVFFHAFPTSFPGGFIGVDIFFVISGFLITYLILNKIEANNFSLIEFYARRIKRLFPALMVVLIICLILGWIIMYPDEYRKLGKHTAAGVGFFANIQLGHEKTNYFDIASSHKPLLHLWSLGIEEQFYLLWPLIILLLVKVYRKQFLMLQKMKLQNLIIGKKLSLI